MKKIIIVLVVIAALITLGLSIKNNIAAQPAMVTVGGIVNENSDSTLLIDSPDVLPTEPFATNPIGQRSRTKRICTEYSDGSIGIGWSQYSGWWIFGHWENGPLTIIPEGENRGCEGWMNGYE